MSKHYTIAQRPQENGGRIRLNFGTVSFEEGEIPTIPLEHFPEGSRVYGEDTNVPLERGVHFKVEGDAQ